MRKFRKFLAVILCLALASSLFVVYVPSGYAYTTSVGFIPGKYPDELYETLYDGLLNCSGFIDISSYNVLTEDIAWVYSSIFYYHPDLYFVGDGYSTTGNASIATGVCPTYLCTGDELSAMRAEYEGKLNAIASQFEGLSDLYAVIAVNDYMTANYEFDYIGESRGEEVFDTYNMIKCGRGVCQAYSLLFLDIMNRLGIECQAVISKSMYHQWNIVKIDSSWYHVDVTWDDGGSIDDWHTCHKYIMLSDTAIANKKHKDWFVAKNQTYVCSSTKYDTYAWNDSAGQLAIYNDMIYFVRNTNHGVDVIRMSKDGRNSVVFNKTSKWRVYDQPGYIYSSSQAGAAFYKNWLIFNTQDELYCYDLEYGTGTYLCNLNPQDGYVYNVVDVGDKLVCAVSERPDMYTNVRKYEFSTDSVHYSVDTDGSGVIDPVDVLSTSMALVNGTDSVAFPDADGSGSFDSSDVLYIKQTILGIIQPHVTFN